MRKFLTIASLIILISGTIKAQSFYLRKGIGYGFPIASSSIGENLSRVAVYSNTGTTYTSSTSGVNASYGAGFNGSYALGYEINKNIIIDMNFQVLMGKHYKTSNTYDYSGGSYVENDYNITKTSAKGFFINPSVIFSAGFGTAAPYGRIGFITGFPSVKGENSDYYNGDGITSRETKWEYTKGHAFGFQSAVGMNWKLSEKFDLFAELNFIGMTYYAGNYTLTKSTYNGNDNLPNMSVSQIETVYKRKFDPSAVNNDSSKPTTALKEATPFSSLSVQAGIKYTLWKKLTE
jgi:hypothetical protein